MRFSGANTENVVTLVFGPANCRNVYAEEEVQRATRKIADHRYHSLKRRFRPIVGFTGAWLMVSERSSAGLRSEWKKNGIGFPPRGIHKASRRRRCGAETRPFVCVNVPSP
jgi:hypothetical protein